MKKKTMLQKQGLLDLAGFSPDLQERLAMIARDHFV